MCSPDAGNLQEKEETNRGKQFRGVTTDYALFVGLVVCYMLMYFKKQLMTYEANGAL